jgi:hypothetical protein
MLHRQTANAGLLALPPMTAQIATALGPALDEPVALQQPSTVHVRFGSKADNGLPRIDVRFTPPKADMVGRNAKCPLCAKSGHADYFDSTLTCGSTTTGSVNAKVEPWPGCESTQILPPCISMMRFDMASPNPVPPFLRVIALSAC